MLTIPKKSTQVHSGQRSTVNFDRTRRVHKGNSASLDVFTNSLGFPSYTSSTPPWLDEFHLEESRGYPDSTRWVTRTTWRVPVQLRPPVNPLRLTLTHWVNLWLDWTTHWAIWGQSSSYSPQSLKPPSKVRSALAIHRSGLPRLIQHVKSLSWCS